MLFKHFFIHLTTVVLLVTYSESFKFDNGILKTKRSSRYPAPFGPTPFAPFGLGPFDAYPGVPVLPPIGYPFPGPFPSVFPSPFPGPAAGPIPGTLNGPIPSPFASPFPSAYPLPLFAPPPAFPSPFLYNPGIAPAPPAPATSPAPLAPSTTGPVIVSAKTAATLSLASIIHALIAKKFYPPIFPFPVPNPLPYAVPIRVPFPYPPNRATHSRPHAIRTYDREASRPVLYDHPSMHEEFNEHNNPSVELNQHLTYERPSFITPIHKPTPKIIPLHEVNVNTEHEVQESKTNLLDVEDENSSPKLN